MAASSWMLFLLHAILLLPTTINAGNAPSTITNEDIINYPSDHPEAIHGANVDSSANVCYQFGCPFLPRDVFYDTPAKAALHHLRDLKQQPNFHLDDAKDALSELNASGDRHRTTLTLCGYKGGPIDQQINQDRSILVSPFLIDGNNYQLVGVLDGHGQDGEVVSEHARLEIPQVLAQKMETLFESNQSDKNNDNQQSLNKLDPSPELTQQIISLLKETFTEVDQSTPLPFAKTGGCTASVALQIGSKLLIANAGDSATMVVAHRSWNQTALVVYQTREDKPHLSDERQRIEAAGGMVQVPRDMSNGDSSRVVYTDPATNTRVGLAMSRSLGDWDAPGVIAEPVVDVLDLRELYQQVMKGHDEFDCDQFTSEQGSKGNSERIECGPPDVNFFVVSATDGLLDFTNPQLVADKLGKILFAQDDKSGAGHVVLTAEELIYHAAKGWHEGMQGTYRDDITIAVSKLFPWEEKAGEKETIKPS